MPLAGAWPRAAISLRGRSVPAQNGFAMPAFHLVVLLAVSFMIAWSTTWAMIILLRRSGRLDHPNERSSHTMPVPRGGGAAILVAFVLALSAIVLTGGWSDPPLGVALLAALFMLALVSWIDDRQPLPWRLRLSVQFAAVSAVSATLLGSSGLSLSTLVVAAPIIITGWLWVINLTNFMDGIDGIVGVEMIVFAVGSALCLYLVDAMPGLVALALVLAAATAGFLCWNWPPAKIFLGDVGSIPLGFLIGFFMVQLAAHGLWGAALALPAIFLADASLTLFARWRRGEKVTQAHRSHFYQRAAGFERHRHRAVILRLLAADIALILAALAGLSLGGWTGQAVTMALAAIIAVLFLAAMQRLARNHRP